MSEQPPALDRERDGIIPTLLESMAQWVEVSPADPATESVVTEAFVELNRRAGAFNDLNSFDDIGAL